MSIPQYGEYISLEELYAERNEGADVVVGTPPETPAFKWQVEAPAQVEPNKIFVGMEDMTRMLRISEVCGAVVRSYTDTTPLVELAPIDEPLVKGLRQEGHLADFYPLWTVDIDTTTTNLTTAYLTIAEEMPPTIAWARATDNALRRGLGQAARIENVGGMRAAVLSPYLGRPILRTATDFA